MDNKLLAQQYLFNTYARYPITLVKGDGVTVWDDQGKKYLDFLSGIACTPLGHNHPTVTQAIIEQARNLLHTSNLYYSPPNILLSQFLVEHGALDKVFFCNSGTEANEAAIKLVRKYQWLKGKKDKYIILSATHSFHGRTLAALTATAKPSIQEGFAPLPTGFRYAPWNDVEQFCAAIDENVAAVILEPIQGEGGINMPSPGFLEAVRAACDRVQALLIFDEIQCGIGRTGKLFAYQYFDVKPDVITLAKGIANGLPLGVICASESVAATFSPGDHGTTFGGNPVSCAAALATLSTLITENHLEKIQQLSTYLFKRLQALQILYPSQIKEVRGAGLMIGVELASKAKEILADCQHNGLLLNITADNVLRMLPPYIITEADIDVALKVISQAIEKNR
jgi:acetylornithine/N-succinyldiaminopimelate aminotransferase